VYYSHQIGTTKSFEQAVPRVLLEKKVRTYLKESVALEKFWRTSVTADALEKEMARITRDSRFPDRLQEVYAALGKDPFLIRECFARPILVDRLARSFFASDERIHGETPGKDRAGRSTIDSVARIHWEDWWKRAEGDFDESMVGNAALPGKTSISFIGSFDSGLSTTSESLNRPESFVPACPVGRWDNGILEAVPRPTNSDRAAAVWTGSLMIVWGGVIRDSDTPGQRYDPTTDTWSSMSRINAPSGRVESSAVWTGERLITWSGYGPQNLLINEGGQYDPIADQWTPVSTSNGPGAMFNHSAVWTGTQMIVFDPQLHHGGRYDPVHDTWLPMALGPFSERTGQTAVWTGSRMIVWGGVDRFTNPSGPVYLNSGGLYDPIEDTWSPTSLTNAPSPRSLHSAVWTGSRMVVWGGGVASGISATGGQYDPTTNSWTSVSTAGAPSARGTHAAVWNGSRMLVWGGTITNSGTTNTGGSYDPSADAWTAISTTNAPPGQPYPLSVWTGNLMLVYGGGLFPVNTGGRYDSGTDSWTPMASTGEPQVRSGNTSTWTGNVMIVWGGQAYSSLLDDGRRYDPLTDTWTPTSPLGAPSPRHGHTAVWTGDRLVVWGGYDGSGLNTGAQYDPIADSWVPTSTNDAPFGRLYHQAVWTGRKMIVWGGYSTDTGGQYDPVTDTWTPTSTTGAPLGDFKTTAVWTGSRMVVWSGAMGGQYDPVNDSWTGVSIVNAPITSVDHKAIWTDGQMLVWGGWNSGYTNMGGRYDPVSDTWLPTSLVNAPDPRRGHTMVWTGSRMIVWGGRNAQYQPAGGIYDPASDTWLRSTEFGSPTPREDHTAVWTGNFMVIYGGLAGEQVSSGGRYDPDGFTPPVDEDGDGFADCEDCDDANAAVHPGAVEVCNGVDDNCVGGIDESPEILCPADANPCTVEVCAGASGCSTSPAPNGTVCDDGNPCSAGDSCSAGACSGTVAPLTISVLLSPSSLRPANHKMVEIVASVNATSSCPGSPSIVLTSITSSEPDDAPGSSDGHTVNDIQGASLGTADFNFQLRAEADKNGTGRIYTVLYTATDSSGQQVTGNSTVSVSPSGPNKSAAPSGGTGRKPKVKG
jgi:N-acetylneuraminic acid mutarotase